MHEPHTRSRKLTLLIACTAGFVGATWFAWTTEAREPSHRVAPRPNFLVVLCDDLGYGDLQCYGHPIIETPHLNALAESGVRFVDFYSSAPVCSPSRVGLLTGRSPNRAGVYDWIPAASPRSNRPMVQMRPQEITIAELLRPAGYATCMAGKWHCNAQFNSPEQAQPGDQGFDHWFATQNNAAPSHENPINFVRNGQAVGPLTGYSCQIVAGEAVDWLSQHAANSTQPFFVYCAFHEPHEPVASPPDLVKKYRPLARNEDEAQYFANVENVDRAVGRLVTALEELGMRENTLVLFTSDNGPETLNRYQTANRSYGRPGSLRGMKLHTYDGGFRVAGIASWPARIQPKQTNHQVASALDLLPTFCRLGGAELPEDLTLDGTDLMPALDGQTLLRSKPLVWAYYNALNEATVAMRQGPWKVVGVLSKPALPKETNLTTDNSQRFLNAAITDVEVYQISDDIGESEDLATKNAALKKRWLKAINDAYRELANGSHVWSN